ncbi:MAG: glycosyltransferase family 2 protein [Gammaproteobacteria bacterium]
MLALVPDDPRPVQPGPPALSVVIPAHDEAGNLGALVEDVVAALAHLLPFEIVCVDDASQDGTDEVLRALAARVPQLRILRHARRGGQSLAIRNGVLAARAQWIATLDGDGQNDPADIPRLLRTRDEADPGTRLIGGWRLDRRDRWSRRLASRIANAVRSRLLRDATPDTGCGIKLFERAAFLDLPYFDHMHRYLPALMQRAGWSTRSVPVAHRARGSGRSHYTNLGRLRVGLVDLLGVAWLIRRSRVLHVAETTPPRMVGGATREPVT